MKTSNRLPLLVKRAEKVIQEANERYGEKIAIAWKGGKDTTVILHIVRKLYGKVPFPVFFNDTTFEFEEVYDFIEQMKKSWHLNLIVEEHSKRDIFEFYRTKSVEKKSKLLNLMKIRSLQRAFKKYSFSGFMVGLRRDEHQSRKTENYFSVKKGQIRIHPLLDFSEADIWKYTKLNKIPYISLYDEGYRSLGEKFFTKAVANVNDERAGRERGKEKMMQKLRDLGYW